MCFLGALSEYRVKSSGYTLTEYMQYREDIGGICSWVDLCEQSTEFKKYHTIYTTDH